MICSLGASALDYGAQMYSTTSLKNNFPKLGEIWSARLQTTSVVMASVQAIQQQK